MYRLTISTGNGIGYHRESRSGDKILAILSKRLHRGLQFGPAQWTIESPWGEEQSGVIYPAARTAVHDDFVIELVAELRKNLALEAFGRRKPQSDHRQQEIDRPRRGGVRPRSSLPTPGSGGTVEWNWPVGHPAQPGSRVTVFPTADARNKLFE